MLRFSFESSRCIRKSFKKESALSHTGEPTYLLHSPLAPIASTEPSALPCCAVARQTSALASGRSSAWEVFVGRGTEEGRGTNFPAEHGVALRVRCRHVGPYSSFADRCIPSVFGSPSHPAPKWIPPTPEPHTSKPLAPCAAVRRSRG